MSDMRPSYDDEIDLFELFETLWDGKWLLAACVALTTSLGFGYLVTAQPSYRVTAPIAINFFNLEAQRICEDDLLCGKELTLKNFSAGANVSWSIDAKNLTVSHTTTEPKDFSFYAMDLDVANTSLTDSEYTASKADLMIINNDFATTASNNDIIAKDFMAAKRVIHYVDNGQKVLTIGDVSISKVSPKANLILALSVILGGFIGGAIVLLRNAIRNRNKRKANLG